MSWSGFKKNVGRATTQVMMKTGHVEKTSDREYEVEERRYRTLEAASLRLQKEAKGYLDSLRAMTASQMRIAETIDAFYGDSGAKDGVSRSYKQAVEDLDAETVKALDGPYRSVDPDLYRQAFDEHKGVADMDVIHEIEWELNYKRTWTRHDYGQLGNAEDEETHGIVSAESYERAGQLMDIIYRTTVLEPISRFCAYFPDINECIKKRNHKMLDYDAMRSKVKKLVEKPDKDPQKLPRAEKEAEMVSMNQFLCAAGEDPTYSDMETNLDVSVPSPPKALNRPQIQAIRRQTQDEEDDIMGRLNGGSTNSLLSRSPSLMSRMSGSVGRSTKPNVGVWEDVPLLRSPSTIRHPNRRSSILRESPTDAVLPRPTAQQLSSPPSLGPRSASMPGPHPGLLTPTKKRERGTVPPSMMSTPRSSGQTTRTARTPTPFFQPSELEELMQPLRNQYIHTQTDKLVQAKAAYEQLNEQLTQELPQLIDLRVPYLDPSFEALVKIQLRFCAEAYSRMAQVQQYLDASTRDQYASGDLDARVEDVLGQIRELSIAGTV